MQYSPTALAPLLSAGSTTGAQNSTGFVTSLSRKKTRMQHCTSTRVCLVIVSMGASHAPRADA